MRLVRMVAHSKRPEENEEESTTLAALTVEGDCVLDFCLEQNSYNRPIARGGSIKPSF